MILQLLCSPIGNRNFREKTKQNITTEEMPQSVYGASVIQLKSPSKKLVLGSESSGILEHLLGSAWIEFREIR